MIAGGSPTHGIKSFFGLSLAMPENSVHNNEEYTLEKCLDLFSSEVVEGVEWDHAPLRKVPPTVTHLVAGDEESFFTKKIPDYLSKSFDTKLPPPTARSLDERASSPPSSHNAKCCTAGTCNALLNWNIARPPSALCLHLQRLISLSEVRMKLESHVKFPLHLDLSPYCKSGGEESTDSVQYLLSSVIVHNGDVDGGHFTCFRRVFLPELKDKEEYQKCLDEALATGVLPFSEEGIWFNISDDKPSLVEEEEVLACKAYMLYYERQRDLSTHTKSTQSGLCLGMWPMWQNHLQQTKSFTDGSMFASNCK